MLLLLTGDLRNILGLQILIYQLKQKDWDLLHHNIKIISNLKEIFQRLILDNNLEISKLIKMNTTLEGPRVDWIFKIGHQVAEIHNLDNNKIIPTIIFQIIILKLSLKEIKTQLLHKIMRINHVDFQMLKHNSKVLHLEILQETIEILEPDLL